MGGRPALALNLLCFPNCLGIEVAGQILAGGAEHDSLVTRERRESLAADEIRAMVFPSEIPALRGEAIKVMLDGLRREIEVEEDKKKESLAPPG